MSHPLPHRFGRRSFLAASAGALLVGRPSRASGADRAANDDPVSERTWRDVAAHGDAVPLELGPWLHGSSSSSADTVLMFRGNPSHTFYGTGPLSDHPEMVWKHRMVDLDVPYYGKPHTWRGTGWTGQAACLGGWVFVGSVGGDLYALDRRTGRRAWRFHSGRMFKSSLCIYDNRIYVGNVDDWLRCLDARTGDVVWRVNTGRDLDSSPVVADGWLYIAGENGWLRCLDPGTGALRWKTFVGGLHDGDRQGSYGSETSPAVADGAVYTATFDGWLHCVDAATGAPRWRARTGADTDASPVVVGDRVYIAAQDPAPYVYCFACDDGREVWRARGGRGFWATPVVHQGVVYLPGHDRVLRALDATDGRQIWRYDIGARSWSSPCVVDDRVVFGAFDGRVRCVDADRGRLVWSRRLHGRVHSTPCIVNGRIFIGSGSGWFYAWDA